jgi:hypothetical protein
MNFNRRVGRAVESVHHGIEWGDRAIDAEMLEDLLQFGKGWRATSVMLRQGPETPDKEALADVEAARRAP